MATTVNVLEDLDNDVIPGWVNQAYLAVLDLAHFNDEQAYCQSEEAQVSVLVRSVR